MVGVAEEGASRRRRLASADSRLVVEVEVAVSQGAAVALVQTIVEAAATDELSASIEQAADAALAKLQKSGSAPSAAREAKIAKLTAMKEKASVDKVQVPPAMVEVALARLEALPAGGVKSGFNLETKVVVDGLEMVAAIPKRSAAEKKANKPAVVRVCGRTGECSTISKKELASAATVAADEAKALNKELLDVPKADRDAYAKAAKEAKKAEADRAWAPCPLPDPLPRGTQMGSCNGRTELAVGERCAISCLPGWEAVAGTSGATCRGGGAELAFSLVCSSTCPLANELENTVPGGKCPAIDAIEMDDPSTCTPECAVDFVPKDGVRSLECLRGSTNGFACIPTSCTVPDSFKLPNNYVADPCFAPGHVMETGTDCQVSLEARSPKPRTALPRPASP